MPHLAGAPCGVCQQPLIGIRDGAFCPRCEGPVHAACAKQSAEEYPAGICRRCGSSKVHSKKWRIKVAAYKAEDEAAEVADEWPRALTYSLLGGSFIGRCATIAVVTVQMIEELNHWFRRRSKPAP